MNKYETLFIVKPGLPEEEVDAVVERLSARIERTRGKVAAVDYWGDRKLAYTIRYRGEKIRRGYYVLLTYLGDGEVVEEVERNIKIMDPTFRYLTTRLDGDFSPDEISEVEVTRQKSEPETPPPAEKKTEEPEESMQQEQAGTGEEQSEESEPGEPEEAGEAPDREAEDGPAQEPPYEETAGETHSGDDKEE